MTDVHVIREENGRHGRYVATVAGIEAEAELVFTHRGPGLISADHTLSPEGLKGTGAGRSADRRRARAGFPDHSVLPLCPCALSEEPGLAGRDDGGAGCGAGTVH